MAKPATMMIAAGLALAAPSVSLADSSLGLTGDAPSSAVRASRARALWPLQRPPARSRSAS
jgi:hypothetical protein